MSVYGASFIRVHPNRATSFPELCGLLRETNASWLAESPTNFTVELIVSAFEESNWLRVQPALADQLLETISRVLGTTVIMIRVMDEIVIRFSYRRFDSGQAVRALEYLDQGNPKERGKWTRVEGDPEPWEAVLFSPMLMDLYGKRAADEVRECSAEKKIKPGLSIPWPYAAGAVAAMARALELPWEPMDNRFPTATQTEVIPGSPERLKTFLRRQRRPWWKFWSQGTTGRSGG